LILSYVLLVSALDLTGSVSWNNACPDYRALKHARAVLDNGQISGSITRNGSFVIPDVPHGTYILSVIAHDYNFDELRIDVSDATLVPEVRPYIPGTPLNPPSSVLLTYPITLQPRKKLEFFMPVESFNLVAMFSNPMMLLMVVGGGMMLAMPYLIKNMDPESLQEFKEQQARMSGIQNAMASGDLKSGFSALLKAAEDPQPSPPTPPTKPTHGAKNRGNKKTRR